MNIGTLYTVTEKTTLFPGEGPSFLTKGEVVLVVDIVYQGRQAGRDSKRRGKVTFLLPTGIVTKPVTFVQSELDRRFKQVRRRKV